MSTVGFESTGCQQGKNTAAISLPVRATMVPASSLRIRWLGEHVHGLVPRWGDGAFSEGDHHLGVRTPEGDRLVQPAPFDGMGNPVIGQIVHDGTVSSS
ncbi:MAG: hypothetical protein M3R01_05080 [Actinomycetota bacterium]|nr:hypothetical protein [Actinomycetota bacterium]